LQLLKEIGWEVQGIEQGENAATIGKEANIDIKCSSFEKTKYPENAFDVVTMWHVLEHFIDPKNVLVKVKKILKDEGLLVIGIPNYNSLDRKLFKGNWNGFEIPLHLQHFTPYSIKKLLEIVGFECRKIVYTIRPSDMAKSIQNIIASYLNIKNSLPVDKLTLLLSIPLTCIFSVLKKSSIIIVHAEKRKQV